jgi:16S rRNA (cytosine967-C5)-methyltransferase
MIAPARVAAYEVVRAVSAGRADLPHALARTRSHLKDERDRALAGEIATGTIRWQGAFDHIVTELAGRPLARLDPEIVDVLRISIFQLLHLDRVPASAAVNDAVSLTRRTGKGSAAPLVNALLRRVSRERGRLPLPKRPQDGT